MAPVFKRAVKHDAKLKMAITGPAGSGKTYTALAIATALVPGGRIAVADTEHESASLYADIFEFDTAHLLPPFHPDRVVEIIGAAELEGYDVLIVDSLSHMWYGPGGLLSIVDEIVATSRSYNSFVAWKEATPIQQRMVEAILRSNVHLIATMRTKQEYVMEQKERGGRTINVPRRVGLAAIQRDGLEYEFDVYLDMDMDHVGTVSKSRCWLVEGKSFDKPGVEFANVVKGWLEGSTAPVDVVTREKSWPEAVDWLRGQTGSFYEENDAVLRAVRLEGFQEVSDSNLNNVLSKLVRRWRLFTGGKGDDPGRGSQFLRRRADGTVGSSDS